jgi:hypothetical protein
MTAINESHVEAAALQWFKGLGFADRGKPPPASVHGRGRAGGIPGEDGTIRGDAVRLVDPEDGLNDWLAIAQFTVIENGNNRRPDVVVFLNGLPVGVIEVKKPGARTRRWARRSTSCRPTRRRSRRSSAPMPCWSRPTASRPASAR